LIFIVQNIDDGVDSKIPRLLQVSRAPLTLG